MVEACKRYAVDNNSFSFGAVKYLNNLKNYHVAGLTCRIQRWIYSSAVKKGLETTFRSLDHQNRPRCCWTIRTIGLYRANCALLLISCLPIGFAESNLDSDSQGDFSLNKKWLLDSTPLEKMVRYAVFIDCHLEAHFKAWLLTLHPSIESETNSGPSIPTSCTGCYVSWDGRGLTTSPLSR